jgi:hypothetical protein
VQILRHSFGCGHSQKESAVIAPSITRESAGALPDCVPASRAFLRDSHITTRIQSRPCNHGLEIGALVSFGEGIADRTHQNGRRDNVVSCLGALPCARVGRLIGRPRRCLA